MSLIEEERIVALARFLNVHPDTITHEGDDRYSCTEQDGEWLVLEDDEADQLAKAQLEEQVEDLILPEIPKQYHSYFDVDGWVRDVLLSDGRGHVISSYDGEEAESCYVDEHGCETWVCIYRVG